MPRPITEKSASEQLSSARRSRRSILTGAAAATGALAVAGVVRPSPAAAAGLFASWVHGTALRVETPENLDRVGYFGWGADMQITSGKSSWFHVPLPTPVIASDVRSNLQRVFIMFTTDDLGAIRAVHVYDGPFKVQQ